MTQKQKIKSKVLRPLHSSYEASDMQSPDSMSDGLQKQVTDEAHSVKQADSFVQEEKTLSEKEWDVQHQHDLGSNHVDVDLQEEQRLNQVAVDQSVTDFEKNKQKSKGYQQRVDRNIQMMGSSLQMQVKRLQTLQADFIAKSASQDNKEIAGLSQKKIQIMEHANSWSNLISLSINDKLMNGGKDKTHEETHVGEMDTLLGSTTERQKSLVINGAVVTLDEDIALAVERQRSPMIASRSSLRRYQAAEGVSDEVVHDVEKMAKKITKELNRERKAIQKEVNKVDSLEQQAKYRQFRSCSYEKMEDTLLSDRVESPQNGFIAPRVSFMQSSREMSYNGDYERQTTYSYFMDNRPVRKLPFMKWSDLQMESTCLPNGRPLPQMSSYQSEYLSYECGN